MAQKDWKKRTEKCPICGGILPVTIEEGQAVLIVFCKHCKNTSRISVKKPDK